MDMKKSIGAYLFLLPAGIVLLLFFFIPFFQTIHLSFFDYSNDVYSPSFVGFENYIALIKSPYDITLVINMDYSKYDIFCSLPKGERIPKIYSNETFSFDKKDIFFLKDGN